MTEPHTPADQGFRMPAEWEPHSGTWLAWPHNLGTWNESVLPQVEEVYLAIIQALVPGETVHILVNDPVHRESVKSKTAKAGIAHDSLRFYVIPTNDAWIRDYGPNFLVSGDPEKKQIALNNWRFNSWGGKYDENDQYDWKLDNRAGDEIARLLKLPLFEPEMVLEGGAIDVNGLGTCLTTKSCLLDKNRNGGLDQDAMEHTLNNYLGAKNIIWLQGEIIEGDDTGGHIDNLARFVNSQTVVCASEENSTAKNYNELNDNFKTLESSTDQDGNSLNVFRLPMPGIIEENSTILPASYANFYIGNRVVLLPVFDVPNDRKAESILQNLFPDRKIVPLPCRELLIGFGGLHCITQQHPA